MTCAPERHCGLQCVAGWWKPATTQRDNHGHRLSRISRRGSYPAARMVLSRLGKLSAIVLIAAVVTATGSTAIALGAQHEACAAKHHTCPLHTAMIAPCCCGHASDASNQGGPVESRVRLTVDLSPIPVALAVWTVADTSGTNLQFHASPPSVSPPELATRFAPLLV
jgi:hypothetical protein